MNSSRRETKSLQKRRTFIRSKNVKADTPSEVEVKDGGDRRREPTKPRPELPKPETDTTTPPTDKPAPPPPTVRRGDRRKPMIKARLKKPSPQMLSDPLDLEVFDLIENYDLQPSLEVRRITIDASALVSLTKAVYSDMCSSSRIFAQNVSLAQLEYAVAIHFHRRLAEIRRSMGMATDEDTKLIEATPSTELALPIPIATWLLGMGYINDEHQSIIQFILPEAINEQGDFGRLDADTHYRYMTIISPRVVSLRLQADIAYTLDDTLPINSFG